MSIRIFRRQFNNPQAPERESKREKEIRIKKVRELVATFQDSAKEEAKLFYNVIATKSSSFSVSYFSSFRYEVEADPPRKKTEKNEEGIQVEYSCLPTTRPIRFTFSWERMPGTDLCRCLAWHVKYGAIRAEVEDSAQGRIFFIKRVALKWPNAVKID